MKINHECKYYAPASEKIEGMGWQVPPRLQTIPMLCRNYLAARDALFEYAYSNDISMKDKKDPVFEGMCQWRQALRKEILTRRAELS